MIFTTDGFFEVAIQSWPIYVLGLVHVKKNVFAMIFDGDVT